MPERKACKKCLVLLVDALAWVLVFTLPEMFKPNRTPLPDKAVMEFIGEYELPMGDSYRDSVTAFTKSDLS